MTFTNFLVMGWKVLAWDSLLIAVAIWKSVPAWVPKDPNNLNRSVLITAWVTNDPDKLIRSVPISDLDESLLVQILSGCGCYKLAPSKKWAYSESRPLSYPDFKYTDPNKELVQSLDSDYYLNFSLRNRLQQVLLLRLDLHRRYVFSINYEKLWHHAQCVTKYLVVRVALSQVGDHTSHHHLIYFYSNWNYLCYT